MCFNRWKVTKMFRYICIFLISLLIVGCKNCDKQISDVDNLGHRLGGDYCGWQPENSLYSYEKLIKYMKDNPKIKNFKYIEFDVQETYDGKLNRDDPKSPEFVVFHDWSQSKG